MGLAPGAKFPVSVGTPDTAGWEAWQLYHPQFSIPPLATSIGQGWHHSERVSHSRLETAVSTLALLKARQPSVNGRQCT